MAAPLTAAGVPAPTLSGVDNPADLSARLRRLSAQQLNVPSGQLRHDALLVDDLGVDSLAAIEWGMTIEDELGLTLPDDVWHHVATFGDVDELVRRLAEQAG
jgi:acyl carrier protein